MKIRNCIEKYRRDYSWWYGKPDSSLFIVISALLKIPSHQLHMGRPRLRKKKGPIHMCVIPPRELSQRATAIAAAAAGFCAIFPLLPLCFAFVFIRHFSPLLHHFCMCLIIHSVSCGHKSDYTGRQSTFNTFVICHSTSGLLVSFVLYYLLINFLFP